MPQGTDALNPDLPSSHPPTTAPDHVTGKVAGHASPPPLAPTVPCFLGWPCSPWFLPVGSGPLRFGIHLDEGLNWAGHPGSGPDLFRKESHPKDLPAQINSAL